MEAAVRAQRVPQGIEAEQRHGDNGGNRQQVVKLVDGRIVLILDVPTLVYTSTIKGRPEVSTAIAGEERVGTDEGDPTLIPGSLADSLSLAA